MSDMRNKVSCYIQWVYIPVRVRRECCFSSFSRLVTILPLCSTCLGLPSSRHQLPIPFEMPSIKHTSHHSFLHSPHIHKRTRFTCYYFGKSACYGEHWVGRYWISFDLMRRSLQLSCISLPLRSNINKPTTLQHPANLLIHSNKIPPAQSLSLHGCWSIPFQNLPMRPILFLSLVFL